ncbi:hypothetical protein CSA37_04965 [Candidatus Fermentibacteria bacterium]|nr:MAG: hypothetical protein CSA37_10255 [Candidatus Fermentibacteria bacterium]PIE52279.1 MAG: hypothetical protein CSA37_07360 [Candidatus Fermentibacteria bacterium]PIE52774.1 MAG: hypothetical protein CSA37_04965 [Candidatus Fermentibacteria bacterium]
MTLLPASDPKTALYAASGSNRGGTGVYTRRLLKGFQLIGASSVKALAQGTRTTAGKLLAENLSVRRHLRREKYDLLHLPAFGGSVPSGIPYAVTVHDMAFMRHPEWFGAVRGLYYRLKFPEVAKRAALIIADSFFTAGEIKELLGLESKCVYLSAPDNSETDELFRQATGITGEYILYTGTVEPRKNIGNLLAAWKDIRRVHSGLTLAVTGRWGWGPSLLRKALENTEGVRWTGSVSDRMIMSAMTGARLMVYPSIYEGFGLPPLESAAAGTPFVIGPAKALTEIYGNVASGIAGDSPESIAAAVLNALETEFSPDDLRNFAGELSLEKTASETLECYRAAVS